MRSMNNLADYTTVALGVAAAAGLLVAYAIFEALRPTIEDSNGVVITRISWPHAWLLIRPEDVRRAYDVARDKYEASLLT